MSLLSRAVVAAEEGEEEGGDGGTVPDERMYCSVVNAMGESGAWQEAVELVQSMRRSSSSRSLADGGGNTDDNDASAAAASVVETPRPGRAAYACACRACARQGEWGEVLGLIENMREDGVPRDASVYASAMRAFVEAGEWERAVEIVTAEVRGGDVPFNGATWGRRLFEHGGGTRRQHPSFLTAF